MKESSIVLPTINLNGTSARSLLEQNREMWSALDKAKDALIENQPHGRDYFIQGNYEDARTQHMARIQRINDIMKELDVIGNAINDVILT